MTLVKDEHRPTLQDLVGPRWRTIAAVLGVLALALVVFLATRSGASEREFVQREGLQFNFRSGGALRQAEPQGEEIVRVERRRPDGLFVQSFAVEPLELPPYEGEPSGFLPVFADREMRGLKARFSGFELVNEGKTRLNQVPGYGFTFRARLGERRLFGREIILPEPVPGSRRGFRLLLLATPSAGVSRAEEVGVRGVIKLPYRTFRYGTEAP